MDYVYTGRKKRTKFAILITTYNHEKYIGEAIESALSQNFEDFEVVVSDDASLDNTFNICQNYYNNKLKVYKNNTRLGRVKNYQKALIEYTNSEYILVLDGDDKLINNNFLYYANKIIKKKQFSLIIAKYNNIEFDYNKKNDIKKIKLDFNEVEPINFFLNLPNNKFKFYHCSCIYNRDLAINLKAYRYNYIGADLLTLYSFFLYEGIKVFLIDIETTFWRNHDKNTSLTPSVFEIAKDANYISILYQKTTKLSKINKTILKKWKRQMCYLHFDYYLYLKRNKSNEYLLLIIMYFLFKPLLFLLYLYTNKLKSTRTIKFKA